MNHSLSDTVHALTPPLIWNAYLRMRGRKNRMEVRQLGKRPVQREICERIAQTLATGIVHDHHGYDALAYVKLPGPNYLATLRALHMALQPKLYVEIGVRDGDSLA
jgi:hypothetical protein